MTLREKILHIISVRDLRDTAKTGAILALIREALRKEAGDKGDKFICTGCMWEVCRFLGEEQLKK